jgi:hypothetical protein
LGLFVDAHAITVNRPSRFWRKDLTGDKSRLDEVNSRYRSQDDLKHKRQRCYQDAVRTQLPISKERDEA